MPRAPAAPPAVPVGFKTIFFIVVGLTVAGGACSMWLATRGPESQTENLKTALQGFLGMTEAGFGGLLGLMVGKGHTK